MPVPRTQEPAGPLRWAPQSGVSRGCRAPSCLLRAMRQRSQNAHPSLFDALGMTRSSFPLLASERAPSLNRTHMKAAIGYLRVSTPEQGRSGIGLAAQRAEIEAFGNGAGFAIKFWHQDIHTGAGRDALLLRPSLKAALKQAASEKCPLIVSRLDRLSRNVHFITGLREHSVHFIVARFGRDLEYFVLVHHDDCLYSSARDGCDS